MECYNNTVICLHFTKLILLFLELSSVHIYLSCVKNNFAFCVSCENQNHCFYYFLSYYFIIFIKSVKTMTILCVLLNFLNSGGVA